MKAGVNDGDSIGWGQCDMKRPGVFSPSRHFVIIVGYPHYFCVVEDPNHHGCLRVEWREWEEVGGEGVGGSGRGGSGREWGRGSGRAQATLVGPDK